MEFENTVKVKFDENDIQKLKDAANIIWSVCNKMSTRCYITCPFYKVCGQIKPIKSTLFNALFDAIDEIKEHHT